MIIIILLILSSIFLQCAQLLRFLGLPVIKSEGEAEACCAFLDKEKVCSLLLFLILSFGCLSLKLTSCVIDCMVKMTEYEICHYFEIQDVRIVSLKFEFEYLYDLTFKTLFIQIFIFGRLEV